jgi:hypothetical protein
MIKMVNEEMEATDSTHRWVMNSNKITFRNLV